MKDKLININKIQLLSLFVVLVGLVSVVFLVQRTQIFRRLASNPDGTAQVILTPNGGTIEPGLQTSIAITVNANQVVELDGYQLRGTISGNIPADLVLKPVSVQGMDIASIRLDPVGESREFSLAYVTSNPTEPLNVVSEDVVVGYLEFTAPISGEMILSFDYDLSKVILHSTGGDILAPQGSRLFEFKTPPVFDPGDSPVVETFILVNTDTNTDIQELVDGQTIYLEDLPSKNLSVRAQTLGPVESVEFYVDENSVMTDNSTPYAIAGNFFGGYNDWEYPTGRFSLKAVGYTQDNASGLAGNPYAINLEFVESSPDVSPTPTPLSSPTPTSTPIPDGITVNRLILVNASTNNDIAPIEDGQTINLNNLPDSITIRAEVTGPVESVLFENAGERIILENVAPYSMSGDFPRGNYRSYDFKPGNLDLVVTPYTQDGAKGTAGLAKSASIRVIDESIITPTSTPTPTPAVTATPTPIVTPTSTPVVQDSNLTISSVRLINSVTDTPIQQVSTNEITVNKKQIPEFTFDAVRGSTDVDSIAFWVNGVEVNVENEAPWSLSGDDNGDYSSWNVPVGQYELILIPYDDPNKGGNRGVPYKIMVNVVDEVADTSTDSDLFKVVRFNLINAETNNIVKPILNGETIDLNSLGLSQINISAQVEGDVGSVLFKLNDLKARVENVAPYALYGDRDGKYNGYQLSAGEYILEAIPYSNDNASGETGSAYRVTFFVK